MYFGIPIKMQSQSFFVYLFYYVSNKENWENGAIKDLDVHCVLVCFYVQYINFQPM